MISGGTDEASRFALISRTYPLDGVTDLSAADGVLLLLAGLLVAPPNDEFSNMARVAANDAVFFTLLPPAGDSIRDGDRCRNTPHSGVVASENTGQEVAIFRQKRLWVILPRRYQLRFFRRSTKTT